MCLNRVVCLPHRGLWKIPWFPVLPGMPGSSPALGTIINYHRTLVWKADLLPPSLLLYHLVVTHLSNFMPSSLPWWSLPEYTQSGSDSRHLSVLHILISAITLQLLCDYFINIFHSSQRPVLRYRTHACLVPHSKIIPGLQQIDTQQIFIIVQMKKCRSSLDSSPSHYTPIDCLFTPFLQPLSYPILDYSSSCTNLISYTVNKLFVGHNHDLFIFEPFFVSSKTLYR